MKILTVAMMSLALIVALSVPEAKAESSFSFSISDGGGHHRPRHHYRPSHHRWQHPHFGPSVIYRPAPVVYVEPAPAVVYESSVVRTPVRYVESSSLVADPASEPYYSQEGQLCREYQSTGWVGGRQSQIYGTACLQPDGAWRVIE